MKIFQPALELGMPHFEIVQEQKPANPDKDQNLEGKKKKNLSNN